MAQSLQSTVTLTLANQQVFGTAWRIDGTHLLVTSRGKVAPGSHAQLQWELDADDPTHFQTVHADVIVHRARHSGESLHGTFRYTVELRAMSHADQHRLGVWLEGRRRTTDADPEQPTDVVLGGMTSLVDDSVTERVVRPFEPPKHAPRRRPDASPARIATRQVRLTRASVHATPGRIRLAWQEWADLEADWVSTLSRGTLYLRGIEAAAGEAFAIVAELPDDRKALLSGRVSACVRGVVFIEVSMGEQTHATLARRLNGAPALR